MSDKSAGSPGSNLSVGRRAPGGDRAMKVLESLGARLPRRELALALAVATVVVAVAFVILVRQWAASDGPMRAVGAPEEQVLNFVTAEAFVRHGFLSRGFLTDYSIDPVVSAPPVYYTHFPPLPSVLIGVMIKFGLDDLREVRFAMLLVTTAGFGLMVAYLWRRFSLWHGIAAVVFFAMDGHGVLPWGDHVVFSYWLGLMFAALWGLTASQSRGVVVGVATMFLIALMNYVQLIQMTALLALLGVFHFSGVTWRRFALACAAGAAGVGVHLIQNAIVLGPVTAARDIAYTIGNRALAHPNREAIREFSQEHDLVLWGVSALAPARDRFVWIARELDFYGVPLLAAVLALSALAYVARVRSADLALRLGAALTLAGTAWHFVFQAHGQAYPLTVLIAYPVNLLLGLAAGEVLVALLARWPRLTMLGQPAPAWTASEHLSRREALGGLVNRMPPSGGLAKRVALLVSVISVVVMADSIVSKHIEASRTLLPGGAAGELAVLEQFRGEPFWTNVTPHLVSYYTKDWVVGQLPLEAVADWDPSKAFVTTVSQRSPTWRELGRPHYFFFSEHNQVLNLPSLGKSAEYRQFLEERYPIVAWSDWGSVVFDLSLGRIGEASVLPATPQFDLFGHVPVPATVQLSEPPARAAGVATGPALTIELTSPQSVSVVRVKVAEPGLPDGISMQLEASQGGAEWESVALLTCAQANRPCKGGWLSFAVLGVTPYRQLRLVMLRADPRLIEQVEIYAAQRVALGR